MTSLDNNTIHLGKLAPAGMLLGLIMGRGIDDHRAWFR